MREKLNSLGSIALIETVLAFFAIAGGLYAIVIKGGGTVAGALIFDIVPLSLASYFWATLLIIGSVTVLYGVYRKSPKIRGYGWFGMSLIRIFQTIGLLAVSGPLAGGSWILTLSLASLYMMLYLIARLEDK